MEAMQAIGIAKEVCRGNAMKYLWRMGDKGDALQDCQKAAWYLNRLIGYLEKEQADQKWMKGYTASLQNSTNTCATRDSHNGNEVN
jgi:hypothetical protein